MFFYIPPSQLSSDFTILLFRYLEKIFIKSWYVFRKFEVNFTNNILELFLKFQKLIHVIKGHNYSSQSDLPLKRVVIKLDDTVDNTPVAVVHKISYINLNFHGYWTDKNDFLGWNAMKIFTENSYKKKKKITF